MIKSWKRSARYRMCFFIGMLFLFAATEFYLLIEYNRENVLLTEQVNAGKRNVYVALKMLPKGSIITRDNVEAAVKYSDAPQSCFVTEADMGKMVSADVAEGMYLTKSMLLPTEENRREVYISEVEIPDNLQDGNRIDVRIRYSNAEDYSVLSDKILQKSSSGNGMILKLTEEEILILSSAIADKSAYSGVRLYAVGYPVYGHAETGKVTYPVRKEILTLLGKEYAEGDDRNALEERLIQNQR